MDLDDVYVLDEPRPRRVWPVIAIAIPVCLFIGLAAWFIRVYIAPPMVAISESLVASVPDTAQAAETTGAAVAAEVATEPAPTPQPPAPVFSSLAFAPLKVPPAPRSEVDVAALDVPAETAPVATPIAGPVPLPHPRPRVTVATNGSAVPLPRPRPQI